MLNVSVSNFGPIETGTIELKPLTVFVGSNNSGKSYLAMLLYALHRALGSVASVKGFSAPFQRNFPPPFPRIRPSSSRGLFEQYGVDEVLVADLTKLLTTWLKESPPNKKRTIAFQSLPEAVQRVASRAVDLFFAELVSSLNQEIERCFGSTIHELVRNHESAHQFTVSVSKVAPPWHLRILSSEGKLRYDSPEFDLSRRTLTFPPIHVPRPLPGRAKALSEQLAYYLIDNLYTFAFMDMRSNLPDFTCYLPAARSGILNSHKALASFLVTKSPLVGLQRIDIPQLSGVLTDFIGNLLTLQTRRQTALMPLAESLESRIIGGQIVVETTKLQYPEIYYEKQGSKYALHQTSSMVLEVAPIILFLKHVIDPGDFLIIEEPESHLHPAIQRQLAVGIAQLIRQNVKVVITTHSDYLLTQLSNFVRRSHPAVRERDSSYAPEIYIEPQEVAAYLFELSDTSRGSYVRPLKITDEDGISDEDFARTAQSLYDETVRLQQ